jgi:hypothetical protein
LDKYFTSTIDMSKAYRFEDRMYFLNENREFMKSSNYLAHAKSNIKLFLDGIRRIDGFPVLAFFSFEDLFLHQNKPAILGCLANLQLYATRSDFESETLSPGEENRSPLSVDYLDLLRTNSLDSLPPSPSSTVSNQTLSPTQEDSSAVVESPKRRHQGQEQTTSATIISIFTLPLAIAFAFAVTLWRFYLGVRSPSPVKKRK